MEFNKAAQSLSDSHFSPEQKKQAQGRLMKVLQLSPLFLVPCVLQMQEHSAADKRAVDRTSSPRFRFRQLMCCGVHVCMAVQHCRRHERSRQTLLQDNVALIAVLEATEAPGRSVNGDRRQLVCVANTHVHSNPELTDVKLWQVRFCCSAAVSLGLLSAAASDLAL